GPAPRRSMSSLWEPDVAPEEPSLYAPKRVRNAASGKPSVELKSRIQQLIQEPESSAPSPTPPSTADEGGIAERYRVPRSLEPTVMRKLGRNRGLDPALADLSASRSPLLSLQWEPCSSWPSSRAREPQPLPMTVAMKLALSGRGFLGRKVA